MKCSMPDWAGTCIFVWCPGGGAAGTNPAVAVATAGSSRGDHGMLRAENVEFLCIGDGLAKNIKHMHD